MKDNKDFEANNSQSTSKYLLCQTTSTWGREPDSNLKYIQFRLLTGSSKYSVLLLLWYFQKPLFEEEKLHKWRRVLNSLERRSDNSNARRNPNKKANLEQLHGGLIFLVFWRTLTSEFPTHYLLGFVYYVIDKPSCRTAFFNANV